MKHLKFFIKKVIFEKKILKHITGMLHVTVEKF